MIKSFQLKMFDDTVIVDDVIFYPFPYLAHLHMDYTVAEHVVIVVLKVASNKGC